MSATPGTREYLDQLNSDIAMSLARNGFTERPAGLDLYSSASDVFAAVGHARRLEQFWASVEGLRLQRRVDAHNRAVKVARGTYANQRAAAEVHAAACKSCFVVHAGDCY